MIEQKNKIINNNCLIALKEMEDNSIDSIVSDPPYGINFMGKKWDYDVPSVEVWQECLRVLKPGGHALIACGTRTQHRMAVNLEDAGFEIRDIVAWVYGSGFPKSHNIGKAVDKLQGNERGIVEYKYQNRIPNGRSGLGLSGNDNLQIRKQDGDTKGSSPYEGWGTALKPDMELWTLCRKPLEEKTIASNVLKFGTGGINIDGCRVEMPDRAAYEAKQRTFKGSTGKIGEASWKNSSPLNDPEVSIKNSAQGRFPANLIHDGSEEVVSKFPDTKSGKMGANNTRHTDGSPHGIYGKFDVNHPLGETYGDSGSASRFFYCAKASKSERNKGLEGFEESDKAGKDFRPNHTEKAEQGEDGNAFGRWGKIKNNHPTIKPIKLMRYLCRLITPKGGTILDPYTGSGSTGIGAKLEDFNFIGIEREEEYCKIAEARIKAWEKDLKLF